MKKWIAVVLALILTLSMTACGGKEPSVSGKVEPSSAETVPINTGKTESAEEEKEPAEGNAVSMGRMEGGTYINEYTGYACDLNSNWTFYSAEELQDLPENVKEMLADTEIGDSMEGVTQFTDMMAENVEKLATVNVLYQKLSMQERLAYSLLDDEQILDEMLKLQDVMIEAYTQMGMEVESLEKTTVTFLGQERTALRTVSSVEGIAQYILQVYDYRLGQYSVTLTATTFGEDNTQWVLDQFYSLNG